jgi:hypothetical protein
MLTKFSPSEDGDRPIDTIDAAPIEDVRSPNFLPFTLVTEGMVLREES